MWPPFNKADQVLGQEKLRFSVRILNVNVSIKIACFAYGLLKELYLH